MDPEDRCVAPRCRREGEVVYFGQPLCDLHWAQYIRERVTADPTPDWVTSVRRRARTWALDRRLERDL